MLCYTSLPAPACSVSAPPLASTGVPTLSCSPPSLQLEWVCSSTTCSAHQALVALHSPQPPPPQSANAASNTAPRLTVYYPAIQLAEAEATNRFAAVEATAVTTSITTNRTSASLTVVQGVPVDLGDGEMYTPLDYGGPDITLTAVFSQGGSLPLKPCLSKADASASQPTACVAAAEDAEV